MTMTDERQSLRDEIQGIERTCARCGASRPTRQTKIVPDAVRGTGELVFGICTDCSGDQSNLRAAVVRDLLDLDPSDPVLAKVATEIEWFSDLPGSMPTRPNAEPWSHIDADHLASIVTRARRDIERRTGGPCHFCGLGLTPEGTTWAQGSICGACTSEFGGSPTPAAGNRDHIAAVLIGLRRNGSMTRPRGLGSELGVTLWAESGLKKPNATPFAHLDIAAMREKADDLQRHYNYFTRPAWWDPETIGRVEWGQS